jgi:hypothetical protein
MNRSREDIVKFLRKRQDKSPSMLTSLIRTLIYFSIAAAFVIVYLLPSEIFEVGNTLLRKRTQSSISADISISEASSEDTSSMGSWQALSHTTSSSLLYPKSPSEHIELKSRDEKFVGSVYLDWIASSDDFGFINYKSLESMLARYLF